MGNQQIINVTTTQSTAVWAFGIYMKVRANAHGYVIEFLDYNENSKKSNEHYPQESKNSNFNSSKLTTSQESDMSDNTIDKTIQEPEMAFEEELKELARTHNLLEKSFKRLRALQISPLTSRHNLRHSLPLPRRSFCYPIN